MTDEQEKKPDPLAELVAEMHGVIKEQNKKIVNLEGRLRNSTEVISTFQKAHAHELRDMWAKLRDKYIMATAQGILSSLHPGENITTKALAESAIDYADALMAAARPGQEPQAVSKGEKENDLDA